MMYIRQLKGLIHLLIKAINLLPVELTPSLFWKGRESSLNLSQKIHKEKQIDFRFFKRY